MDMEVFWNEQEYDFYKSLSPRDKLIYFSDMYSGFFDKLGDEEDDILESSEEDALEADMLESLFSNYDKDDENKRFIKIQSTSGEDITPVLVKLFCDGFILKKHDMVRTPNGDTHRFLVIGQGPPTSLN